MSSTRWETGTWAYFLAVVAMGAVCVVWSLLSGAGLYTPDFRWLVLILPLVLLRNAYIQLPNMDGRICPASVFVVYGALVWGAGPAALIAALEALLNSFHQTSQRWRRMSFNVAALSSSIFFATRLVDLVFPRGISAAKIDIFGRALFLSLGYYLFSMGLILAMVLLSSGRAGLDAARSALLWGWIEYAIAGLVSGTLGVVGGDIAIAILAGAAVLWLTHKALAHYFGVLREREALVAELRATHTATLQTLATAIEAKDPHAHGHAVRVYRLAEKLGRVVGMEGKDVEALRVAALLHDIGKLAIPEYLLYQEGERNVEDRVMYQRHATLGAQILEHSRLDENVKRWVRHHHERYDGLGYPFGLAGEEIPFGARVLALVNIFDNLRYPRLADERSLEEALAALREEAGKTLDPTLVDIFCSNSELQDDEVVNALSRAGDGEGGSEEASFVEDFQMSHKEARVLYKLLDNLRATQALDKVLDHVLDAIDAFLSVDGAAVFLPDKSTGKLQLVYVAGKFAGAHVTPPDEDRLLQCCKRLATNDGVCVDHGVDDGTLCPLAPPGAAAQRQTCVAFRVALRDKHTGFFLVHHPNHLDYSSDYARVVRFLIDHAAPSVANALEYQQFQKDSLTDGLTGLWNQRALRHDGADLIDRMVASEHGGCLVMIDLNGFKGVNDTLGHRAGDELLVAVARTMKEHVRATDFVARNGGDEFVIILPNVAEDVLDKRMTRLYEATCALWPDSLTGARGISYGCAWFPSEGNRLEPLLALADERMYADKQRKKAGR